MQVTRVREADRLVLFTDAMELRTWPYAEAGVEVTRHEPGGRTVALHDDLRALTRSTLRMMAADRDAVAWLVAETASRLEIEVVDEDPVTALPRLAYPLLRGVPGFPLPCVPGVLPPSMRQAFRSRSPKDAATLLFGAAKATRPVVRELCRLLERGPVADLFPVSLAVAAREHLEPDHLAAVLSVPAPPGADGSPVADADLDRLAAFVGRVPARRAVALLEEAIGDATDRVRLRHVASTPWPDDVEVPRCWEDVAAAVTFRATPAAGVAEEELPAADPTTAIVETDLVLRRLTTVAELRRVSARLHNCLHLYGHQLQGRSRIFTADRDGRPDYAVHVRDGRVVEMAGDRNRMVPSRDRTAIQQLLDQGGHLAATRQEATEQVADRYLRCLAAQAAEVLLPPAPHRTDWTELAATLWALGVVESLPDAADSPMRQVVLDLAGRIQAGEPIANRYEPRPPQERMRAASRLSESLAPWRRTHMAAALRYA